MQLTYRTGMTYVGGKIHTALEALGQQLLSDIGRLALKRPVRLSVGAGILRVVHSSHVHTSLQLIVNLILVALGLEHVLTQIR